MQLSYKIGESTKIKHVSVCVPENGGEDMPTNTTSRVLLPKRLEMSFKRMAASVVSVKTKTFVCVCQNAKSWRFLGSI